MFPTSGYFRSIPCPFFATGLCERPNCHYRHVKSVSESSAALLNDNVRIWNGGVDEDSGGSDKPYLLRLVREAVLQVQKEVEADKLKLNDAATDLTEDDKDESPDADEAADDDIEIRDTLLDDADLVLPDKDGSGKFTKQQKAPEYTPTPIAKLKILRLKQLMQEQQQTVTLPQASSSNVLEYDPTESCPNSKKLQEMTVDYKPSPKVSCAANSSSKSKPSKSWSNNYQPTPNSFSAQVKSADVLSDSDNGDISEQPPAFSDEDEADVKTTKVETKIQSTASNYDVVNRILNESKFCESAISTASLKKDKQTKISAKNETNKTSAFIKGTLNKPKQSLSSNKESKKKLSKTISSKSSVKTVNKSKAPVPAPTSNKSVESIKNSSVQQSASVNKKSSDTKSVPPKKVAKVTTTSKSVKKAAAGNEKKKTPSPVKDKKSSQTHLAKEFNGVGAKATTAGITNNGGANNNDLLLESLIDDSDEDLDEHDTYEECLRIFNEYVPQQQQQSKENNVKNMTDHRIEKEPGYTQAAGKKRIAHDGGPAQIKRQKTTTVHQPNPSTIMQNRLIQSLQICKENRVDPQSSADSANAKRRIAHTPCYQPPPAAKKSLLSSGAGPSTSQITKPTLAQTAAKGAARVAHIPSPTTLQRPMIPAEFGCRVPINIRQRYLNMIIDECLNIYTAEQDAFDRAVNEEKSSYDRSPNRTIYLNSVANTIRKLRNEKSCPLPPLKSSVVNKATAFGKQPATSLPRPPPQRILSHEAILNGKKGAHLPIGIQKKKIKPCDEPLTGAKLYNALKPYVLTKELLEANGYPFVHPTDPSRAFIHKPDTKNVRRANPLEKICARCGSSFEVSQNGVYITRSECFYHWGRVYKKKIAGSIEGKYSCCGERAHSPGCCVADLHVFEDTEVDNLKGFIKTMPKSPPWDGNCGVFALDCEMSYTNRGMELVRVTVIGPDLKTVYETLVKPENPVVDYNTKFSGITKEDLDAVVTSIRDVQAVLLSMFNDQTILIGHSLESDLKALKLIHRTVVDTSIVFPHRLGLPYKRALRNLSAELLGKFIQNDVNGHDSKEDATACMELMLYKIRESMKRLS